MMLIHRWWGGPNPEPTDTLQAVLDMHPDATLVDHDDEWIPDGKCRASDQWRHAANVLRYRWLYEQGGLWLDHDIKPLADLTKVAHWPWVSAYPPGRKDGAIMFFPRPGHSWLGKLLRAIEHLPLDDESPAPRVSGFRLLNSIDDPTVRVMPNATDATSRDPLAIHLNKPMSRMSREARR